MHDLDLHRRYFLLPAAAFVRGKYPGSVPFENLDLEDLSEDQLKTIFLFGKEAGLKMHKFKRTMELPRVNKVLGILSGLQPERLLDIGTGRGVFLWPFLERFPNSKVTCIDILDYRVDDLQAVRDGGINRLEVFEMPATELDFEDGQFDVVTALEVIEHIPEHRNALKEICRVANQFVVISVPSKEDDNPEHLQVLDQAWFKTAFIEIGVKKFKFDYILNHLVVVANMTRT